MILPQVSKFQSASLMLDITWIFPLGSISINILKSIPSFLVDSKFTFVGVGVTRDIAKLNHEYELDCSNSIDFCNLKKRKCEEWTVPSAYLDRTYASDSIGHKLLMDEEQDLNLYQVFYFIQ